MRRLTTFLLLGFMAPVVFLPAIAQDLIDETAEAEIRRYTVEVIVFRYAQNVGTGSEVFLPDEPDLEMLLPDDGMELIEELPPEPVIKAGPLPDTELKLLDPADYKLNDTMGRMRRLDVYDPVMHFGWTQATWPQEQTAAIPLHRFARPPSDLDGNLTLYLGRYLHLIVDLQLDARSAGAPVYYRLQENRIQKNGELRYYDHPKFGVLAMVTRVEENEENPGEGELLGYGSQ